MQSLSLLFLIIGIIFIVIGYNERISKCPLQKLNIDIFLVIFMKNKIPC